jgi:hypothetical protein
MHALAARLRASYSSPSIKLIMCHPAPMPDRRSRAQFREPWQYRPASHPAPSSHAPRYVNRGRSALVHTFRLRPCNTLKLTFTTDVSLELCEHLEHIKEAFARCGACINRLLCSLEMRRAPSPRADILQIADAAGQAVNARDHQHVTLAEEVEDGAQFLPSCRARAAALLSGSAAFSAARWMERC